ncbi:hypothetical protein K5R29_21350 [Escherichia sp. M626]|nr:hypothetical protein [Escherichia sp. M626]
MIWQPEFTDKTLSRKPGAVQSVHIETIEAVSNEHVGNDELCRKIATISGIAILTTTAIVSTG